MQFEHEVDTAGREFDFDHLLRRVTHGEMIGEISHPTRRPNESQDAFSQRLLMTRLDRACCAVSGLRLTEAGKLIVVLEPAGPQANVLVQMSENGQTPRFGCRAVMDDKNITFIAFDLINAPTQEPDLDQRLSNSVAQLNRYGGLYSHALADVLESLTCINDDMHHDRGPNCIKEFVDKTKTELDALYADYLKRKN